MTRFRTFTMIAIATAGMLGACSRPLTQNETLVAQSLFGDTLDTEAVTVMAGIGVLPLPREPEPEPGAVAAEPISAPPGLCERKRRSQRYWDWPAAFVLENDVYFSYEYYPHDAFRGFPESAPYPASVLMAHELVHVWQWQNRDRTDYTTNRAAGETLESVDPYWFVADRDAEFLSYGYEQQGAMVQDFVCYALFDRQSPRLAELAAILRPVLRVDDFLAEVARR